MKANTKLSVYNVLLFAQKIMCLLFLINTPFSEGRDLGWTVRVLNVSDEPISVNINSSLMGCSFKKKQVNPNELKAFHYKDIKTLCLGACTSSVEVTSPVKLKASRKLTSCSNVFVVVRKDSSNKWHINYTDWFNDAAKIIEERNRMPKKVQVLVDEFMNSPIQELSVFRKPIQAGVKQLLETLTKKELKKLNYDQLYHTGFVIKCDDKFIRLERNETITNTIIDINTMKDAELKKVVLSKPLTYGEFIAHAMENDPTFWKYHPVKNNCQLFVLQCLEKNNIELTEELHTFIYQNASEVLAKNPILKGVAINVTSLANRIDRVIEGTSDVTIQNGTPYTIRVRTRYVGESKRLKICRADDFLLKPAEEKNVSHGICLLESIKVAASSKGIDTIKALPHEQLKKSADIFAESSFARGKVSANFLIKLVKDKKIVIENIGSQHLSTQELQEFAKTKPSFVKTK